MVYTIITLNGRGYEFEADGMTELGDEYYFELDGEVVARFRKDCIAGCFISRYEDDEEAD